MPQFFLTRMGHTFYEGTVPAISRALATVAEHVPTIVTSLQEIGESLRAGHQLGRRANTEQHVLTQAQVTSHVEFGTAMHKLIEAGWTCIQADPEIQFALFERDRVDAGTFDESIEGFVESIEGFVDLVGR
jgi:hypothetical protein